MSVGINNFSFNLHKYDQKFHRPIADLVEILNLSKEIPQLEESSKDLKVHQWKKISLYVTAGALILTTVVLAVLFFKVTLPYIIAHTGMGIGDSLGTVVAGHLAGIMLSLVGLIPIYERLTVDSEIERLKAKHNQLESRIEIHQIKALRECLITEKNSCEKNGINVRSLVSQIKVIDEFLADRKRWGDFW